MSAPKSLFTRGTALSANDMMSRAESQAMLERVVKLSKADGVLAQLTGGYKGNVRFAANRVTTSGGVTDAQLQVKSSFGGKHASVTTGDFTEAGIERAVRQSEAIAKLAPDDPEAMPLLPPQAYSDVRAHFDATANLAADERTTVARLALDAARGANDLTAAGYVITANQFSAIASSTGLFAYHQASSVNYTLTMRTTDGTGSGWAGADHPDWRQIDFKAVTERASETARASRNPVGIEPGRYTVIMEPQAVSDLVQPLAYELAARSADEGRSAFSKQGG
ncbi:MAG: TldD/PmbA family protein, partial [bacterium]